MPSAQQAARGRAMLPKTKEGLAKRDKREMDIAILAAGFLPLGKTAGAIAKVAGPRAKMLARTAITKFRKSRVQRRLQQTMRKKQSFKVKDLEEFDLQNARLDKLEFMRGFPIESPKLSVAQRQEAKAAVVSSAGMASRALVGKVRSAKKHAKLTGEANRHRQTAPTPTRATATPTPRAARSRGTPRRK